MTPAATSPTRMKGMKRTRPLLAAMTRRVGRGRSAPSPANSVAKVGMTFHRITATPMAATELTAVG